MHGRTKLVTAAVAAAVLSLFGASGPAESAPAGSGGIHGESAAARAPQQLTHIHLRVKYCPRCPVYLQQAFRGDVSSWTSQTHRVRYGRVQFTVPTRRTHGMSFVFNPRWANVTNARTNVVTRYAHTQVGDYISNRVAKRKHRATGCWAGTNERRVHLLVRAVKFRGPALGGGPGHALRAWFRPMTESTPYWQRTYRGSIGNQDAYFCRR